MSEYNHLPLYTLALVRNGKVKYPAATCRTADESVAVLQTYLWDKEAEHLVVLMVDGHHNYLGLHLAAQGGIHGLHVGVRDVFKGALLHRASAIVLAHNHPSGDVSPSSDDMTFTQNCIQVGKILGCPVLDHIIISSGVHPASYSFLAHGLLG